MKRRGQQKRVAVILLGSIVIFATMYVLFAFISTLKRLDVIEADRDRWQRPSDVLKALDLHEAEVAVDLGSGAGYFSLKLSPLVGQRGEVIAVDIRRLSLFFLRIRAILRNQHNLRIIVGDNEDPRLPAGQAYAVLICNTYHEFSDPNLMLRRSFEALRPGGRLVIVDRGPRQHEGGAQHHDVSLTDVEEDALRGGFTIARSDARFIEQPDDDRWWLLVARRP